MTGSVHAAGRQRAGRIDAPIPAILAAACLACGVLMSVKVVVIGELYLGEIFLVFAALVLFLLRGVGASLAPWFFWTFAGLGAMMLLGYMVSDLIAVTGPSQYLRGWARTAVFGIDLLALLLVVSHGERTYRWLVVGLVVGQLARLVITETPLTMITWKTGYGFPIGLAAALLSGYLPPLLAALLLGSVGVTSVLLDFRSLGGIFLLAAGFVATRAGGGWHQIGPMLRGSIAATVAFATVAATVAVMSQSEDDYHLRRLESNAGRYSGLLIASEAIAESPIIGYGSWAVDKAYARKRRQEFERATAGADVSGRFSDSLLPHSQLLQAWIEGGIFAAAFFFVLAVNLVRALRWLALHHRFRPMSALYAVMVVNGLWELLFSPFLGPHRFGLACTMAALALLARERDLERPPFQRAVRPPRRAAATPPRA